MRDRDLQHPDITAAERTGYPNRIHTGLSCDWCFGNIYDGEVYFDVHGEILCSDCMDDCRCIAGG